MNTPIKHEDIRKGDRVRMVHEYTAGGSPDGTSLAYELIERPVQLPTEPGIYADRDGSPWDTRGGAPLRAEYGPYTLLRPVAEVAAEVLAEVQDLLGYDVDPCGYVAAKFGASK